MCVLSVGYPLLLIENNHSPAEVCFASFFMRDKMTYKEKSKKLSLGQNQESREGLRISLSGEMKPVFREWELRPDQIAMREGIRTV